MPKAPQALHTLDGERRSVFYYAKYFLPLLRGSYLNILLGMLSLILSTFLLVKASVALGEICAHLGSHAGFSQGIYLLMLSFVALEAGSVLAQYLGRTFLASGTNAVLLKLRCALFEKIDQLPMSYYDAQPLGRIITRLTSDVDGVEGFFGGGLARIATACVQICLVLIGIITIAPKFGLAVVMAAMPALCFSWFTRKPLTFWLAENKARNAHVNSKLAEFIQALPVLRVLGLEQWSGDEFNRDAKHHLASSIKVLSWNSFIRPLTVFLSTWPTLVAVLWGGFLLLQGQVEIAALVAVLRLTERFSNPVRVVTQEIQVIQDATASAVRVGEMLSEANERTIMAPGSFEGVVRGEIRFESVGLSYRSGHAVLRSLDLLIPPGQKLGVIGQTGAGKSSLLNLIPALYVPSSGRVVIDSVDIREWTLSALRSQIGYLAQDPFLFKGALAANILGIADQNSTHVRQSFETKLDRFGLGQILERFNGGLNFLVNEGGSNLSSGEKQMIAFLRLLHEDRPILLMDEATSCLDRAWESAIQGAILALMRERRRTCVIIAHRLETLKSCDRVIRIHDGKIVADGKPTNVLGLDLT
jgi:ABC-type multidrug transport system fused ATPase/permease subunit